MHKKSWLSRWWYNHLKVNYTKKMLYHKKLAEYNLFRHNEAVEYYNQKKNNRSLRSLKSVGTFYGYYIADEGADNYAKLYNENWDYYIKFKNKLEVLDYETLLEKEADSLPSETNGNDAVIT